MRFRGHTQSRRRHRSCQPAPGQPLQTLTDGSVRRCKARTTPEDQSLGVLNAIAELGIDASNIAMFSHGNTVGINTLPERKDPLTSLLCTEGMRDMLDMGGLARPSGDELYDATWIRPHLQRPLVHRRRLHPRRRGGGAGAGRRLIYIRDVRERLLSDGSIHVPLDEESVRRQAEFPQERGRRDGRGVPVARLRQPITKIGLRPSCARSCRAPMYKRHRSVQSSGSSTARSPSS
ncbi:hydantoinase/oxoprolinase N-terminal domain-containing protein [Rhodococcus opacus]|uniref:hydantoinase/oxoprolinase N-terminal domain-containing protein n=1 Tax=Rhodococcus opacus TaxID=37919 RepID=UPI00155A166A